MKKHRVLWYSLLVALFLYAIGSVQAQEPRPIINASLIGKVIDAKTQEPLTGVTVQLEAVTHSVQTDNQGNFQFVTGQKLPFTLIVSFVGYEKKQVVVNSSPTVIALSPVSTDLDEVVVLGTEPRTSRSHWGCGDLA
ncbi:hypothetical protein QE382_002445 [Sphingobacterium zeae]|uniref:CarboxypepD_reg-like domain-containing protein n=1 Tax=Sphingobacterium zeae TaxID=1776859 RepID=A0ABU0U884_9SPHI|nr:carboxypeptidase-like regulatory domain-containing protein [Sphingobacterium zeae]MDQ1150461.1 hypothetical protein [Sphingobacterium zeae]